MRLILMNKFIIIKIFGGNSMKKWFLNLVLIISIIFSANQAFGNERVEVFFNGDKIHFSVNPITENGTTLVEFRTIFEKEGLNILWQPETQTITGEKNGLKIELTIGEDKAKVNNLVKKLLVAPKIVNGYTLVPLRFVGESTGSHVKWDDSSPQKKTIAIYTRGAEEVNRETIIEANYTANYVEYNDGLWVGISEKIMSKNGYSVYNLIIKNNGDYIKEIKDFCIFGFGANGSVIELIYLPSEKLNIIELKDNYILNKNEVVTATLVFKDVGINKINYSDYRHRAVQINIPIQQANNIGYNDKEDGREIDDNKIDNTEDLLEFLEDNFSTLDTIIGTTKFSFEIDENDRDYFPWDYWIQVGYEYEFFEGAMYSIKYSKNEKETLKEELKDHMKYMAESVIKKMPNKKFYGGYYDSWYRYPNLRVDLQTTKYFSWTNYDKPNFWDEESEYDQTKPGRFRWYTNLDDEL